jgi:hypothetical protein
MASAQRIGTTTRSSRAFGLTTEPWLANSASTLEPAASMRLNSRFLIAAVMTGTPPQASQPGRQRQEIAASRCRLVSPPALMSLMSTIATFSSKAARTDQADLP